MKWFKHISDSISDPFIFDLMTRFGSDGYLVFFGILEIYAREFKPEVGWKLEVTRAYLKQKFIKRQDTLIINSLKHIQNSGKWEIEINGDQITIYIPKFKELLDNWTAKQIPKTNESLRSNDVESIQPIRIKNKEEDKYINKYSEEFLKFYSLYPNKKEKPAAYKSWQKLSSTRPPLQTILDAIQKQIDWRKNANGEFRPDWKHPATWLNRGCWEDELKIEKKASW